MKDAWQQRLATVIISLVILAIPAGTAVQSIALGLTTIGGIILLIIKSRDNDGVFSSIKKTTHLIFYAYLAYALFIIWQIAGSLINPKNTAGQLIPHAIGMLAIIVVPPLLVAAIKTSRKNINFWLNLSCLIFTIWSLTAISQSIWGWQLNGSVIDISDHYKRARGFYSHPLTLAYVVLCIWPLVLNKAMEVNGRWQYKLLTLSTASLIILSQSRTVQVCAILIIIWNIFIKLRGKKQLYAILSLAVLISVVATTKNPISERFYNLTVSSSSAKLSGYPDDRLAFWHAFSKMIYERPLLGHGIRLDEEYRTPYYDQIGLSSFSKKYPAHNQLLQIQAESGLIGLVFFMAWIIISLKIFNQLDRKNSLIFKQTLLILLMAGLTQNAFQDSEVRFILTLLFSAALLRLSESVSQYDALGAQSSDLKDRKSARHKKYETRLPA